MILRDFGTHLMMESCYLSRWLAGGAQLDVDESRLVDYSAGPARDAQNAGAPLVVDTSGIASVRVGGLLNKRYSYGSEATSYIGVAWALQAAAADPKVKNVLMVFDSGGGYTHGMWDAVEAVRATATVKPVIAQVDDLTASAAYAMASQATRIVANVGASVGSIGVLGVLYDTSKMLENEGIKAEVFATGAYKWAGVMGTSLTDEQRAYIQGEVDTLGNMFVANVARGRRRSEADIKKIADGRVFGAAEALGMGLIDGISSYQETASRMRGELLGAQTRDSRMRSAILDLSQRQMAAKKDSR